MSYISLYRKYRSQSFGEVVGQHHVTTVLQNAIRMGRISHAYLLCGPRGCGKTSTARLIARALNCLSEEGPTAEPCGMCDMCAGIREGSTMDVIEMDAASETGIDDVREKIIENAKFAPAAARYKVYIIDEVHDLSLKAFDSLLKTIEEPPAHVVFILATTEAHKVPITVRSRCQRLDFRRGTLADLTANLRRVLDAESISYEPEAVSAVARAAEGSFRDSLSILEQVLAYTDGALTAECVHAAIGTVGAELLDEVTRILASDDMNAAFLKAGELVDSGKDVRQTLIAVQNHLRDLLVASVAKGPSAIPDVSVERFNQLKEQSSWFQTAQILKMLDILAETERDIRFTNQHRLLLERAFWSILPASLASFAVVSIDKAPAQPATREPRAQEPKAVESAESPIAPKEESVPLPSLADFTHGSLDLAGIRRIWPRVSKRIMQRSRSAAAYLEVVQILGLEGDQIILGVPSALWLERMDPPERRKVFELAFAEELKVSGLKVRCRLAESPSAATELDSGSSSLEFSAKPLSESPNGASHVPASESESESTGEPSILKVVHAEFGDRLLAE